MSLKYENILLVVVVLVLAFMGNTVDGASAEPEPKSGSNNIGEPYTKLLTAVVVSVLAKIFQV